MIDECAFKNALIKSIFIPSHFEEFGIGWCEGTSQLNKLSVIANNRCYICLNSDFIIGKSNDKIPNYDVLCSARRDIEMAYIPSFIEIIDSCAFNSCEKLKTIEFTSDSKLRIIENNAFSESSLKKKKN